MKNPRQIVAAEERVLLSRATGTARYKITDSDVKKHSKHILGAIASGARAASALFKKVAGKGIVTVIVD